VDTTSISCRACGNRFNGKYCNACGEKVYNTHDKSLKHLAEEIFHFFTHFEGKFFRTLKLILSKPGSLSRQYCDGVRKPFYKPISFFFLCVIIYLLFPLFGGLNMKFNTYTTSKYGYTFIVNPIIEKKLENKHIKLDELKTYYDSASPKFAKVLILLFLPLSALVLYALFAKRKVYFFDHFILATELNSFYVFVGYIAIPALMYLLALIDRRVLSYFHDGGMLFKIVWLLYLLVTISALRRFYNEKWGWTILKGILFFLAFSFVIKFIYNIIIFFLVTLFI
jgi:tryptophan-rich sensory protein